MRQNHAHSKGSLIRGAVGMGQRLPRTARNSFLSMAEHVPFADKV